MSLNKCVKGGALYFPPMCSAIPKVRAMMRFQNPQYTQYLALKNQGRFIPKPPEFFYGCREIEKPHPWAGGLMAPRYLDLEGIFDGEIIDRMVVPEAFPLRLAIEARDYQAKAIDLMSMLRCGVVVAPCGSGKTTIGIAAMARFPTRAIVLVHTKDLATQWIERCREQLVDVNGIPVEATLIGDGVFDASGRVVVGLYQSLAKISFLERLELGKNFGLTICDEVHHVPAVTFSDVVMSMPGRYRLGLTATPDREDGLSDLIQCHVGIKLMEITHAALQERGLIMIPKVERLDTNWSCPVEVLEDGTEIAPTWNEVVDRMVTDRGRNATLLTKMGKLVGAGRQVLFLSKRVDHCIAMARALQGMGIASSQLVGPMTSKKRSQVLQDARERKLSVVTATQLADEALDLPALDTVIPSVPSKKIHTLLQQIGRTMRPHPGKQKPLVVDPVDNGGGFEGLYQKRARAYRKIGCEVEVGP